MKKLALALIVLISLSSCKTMISDEAITVEKQFKIRRDYYYKYFYECKQHNRTIRVYSNEVYEIGRIIKLQ